MKQLCKLLIRLALRRQATDIHLEQRADDLIVSLRTDNGLEILDQDIFHIDFLEYLKFISGMDLCSPYKPQSTEFSIDVFGENIECRFSLMNTDSVQTGVIRLLHTSRHFKLGDLCSNKEAIARLERMAETERGLIIACGPTGSGKSTTIHAMLNEILEHHAWKIVTLEDPIEIHEPDMVQIQVNEARGITYENSIAELLRHDPDLLFFGECRNAYTAKMTLRASLTGHVVYTTLHCGSGIECLYRLMDLGIDSAQLKTVLKGIIVCRLVRSNERKECIYELWNEEDIEKLFENKDGADPGLSFETCLSQTENAAH